ncbi:bifunctional 6-phosphofructo-2-kinase/fructose-2,6-bisphosphate 2-phosphatase [Aaosphaeria arxii CBS 175.79]|uniref:Bifunctional 6-phosphofructo-2-kinase/fructose-2,6-bisphosphate 2-phosphatase n=1 Tax=Aaosphaeria arxii CBS 175.79 TaxID=1450172 RepID=A0A6A5XL19_9PLEO|nr:bifunctional 6-phosphofructo-2-kinase/fructose-2,6-bisphosphate 2-phosphatase [Aaosphaeria arxii CBS 175.79]KAF2012994.1 bifunctional 6-phosphofructo-2-kinase/fructose-2,6-bisphosphate 2-phosphatase [Aaosphaeria arxii CBS 175.79]
MVGLPARGKSYIVKKLARYLNWLRYKTMNFNVGERRRLVRPTDIVDGPVSNESTSSHSSSAAFFDPANRSSVALRDQVALQTLDELLDWLLLEDGTVGILDATNNTPERRRLIRSHIRARAGDGLNIIYLESRCFDEAILETNMRLKLSGPDYKDKDHDKALADFRQRVSLYEKSYVPLGEAEEADMVSYIQTIDVGRKINTHLAQGFLATQMVEYLLNFNLSDRQIWISCNGESIDDGEGKIGRNSDLSDHGKIYSQVLARFIDAQRTNRSVPPKASKSSPTGDQQPTTNGSSHTDHQDFGIWTSTMPQAIETALPFDSAIYPKRQMKMLDDLNAGIMAGLTYSQIQTLHPDEYAARKANKLLYRWPGTGGEGYIDVINRLRVVILELERVRDHLLLVTHRAVVRVLLAYFWDLRRDELADLEVAKDTVFCLQPKPYGIKTTIYRYSPETEWFEQVPNNIPKGA